MLTAGCVGTAQDDTETEPASTPTSDANETTRREETRTFTYEQNVGLTVTDAEAQVGTMGTPSLAPAIGDMELTLSWNEPANGFALDVELADGSTTRVEAPDDPSATSTGAEISVDGQPAGTYQFDLVAPDGTTVSDTVTLEGTVTIVLGETASDEVSTNDVETERTDDGWLATQTFEDTGQPGSQADLDADTVNGAIELAGSADEARAVVTAYAEADSEDEAIDRVQDIQVTVRVQDGEVTARAEVPDDDWEDRGANVDADVTDETTLGGEADTTNGAITLDESRVTGIRLDTTNGPIQGSVSPSDRIEAGTTNGAIELDVEPTESAELEMGTTNGAIELGLTENEDIAYEVDASTTNDRISEAMDEAELERQGEGQATLVTENGEARPIQVTGETDTTNGAIAFQGR
ncbi:hypothetical protein BRD56_06125 [Thermoplasmatales archaeon SW_10_69_26]|nr:MAG: hypothetical protein BRD56_06125 [Thermoplasmatales archaeon SW_10_69_26]